MSCPHDPPLPQGSASEQRGLGPCSGRSTGCPADEKDFRRAGSVWWEGVPTVAGPTWVSWQRRGRRGCAWRVSVNRAWFVGPVGRAPGQRGPELPEGRQCPRGPQRRRGAHWWGRCPPDAQVSSTSEATVRQKKKGFCPHLWKTGARHPDSLPWWPPGCWQRLPLPPPPLLWAVASSVAALPCSAGEEFPTGGPWSSASLPVGESGRGISNLSPRGALCPKLRELTSVWLISSQGQGLKGPKRPRVASPASRAPSEARAVRKCSFRSPRHSPARGPPRLPWNHLGLCPRVPCAPGGHPVGHPGLHCPIGAVGTPQAQRGCGLGWAGLAAVEDTEPDRTAGAPGAAAHVPHAHVHTGSHVLLAYFVPRTQSRCRPNRTPGRPSPCPGAGLLRARVGRAVPVRRPHAGSCCAVLGSPPDGSQPLGSGPPPGPATLSKLDQQPRGATSKQPHGRSGFQRVNLGTPAALRHAAQHSPASLSCACHVRRHPCRAPHTHTLAPLTS